MTFTRAQEIISKAKIDNSIQFEELLIVRINQSKVKITNMQGEIFIYENEEAIQNLMDSPYN